MKAFEYVRARNLADALAQSAEGAMPFAGIANARVVLGHVGPSPRRLPRVEAFLANKQLDEAVVEKAGAMAAAGATPLSQNAYKVGLVGTLVKRALRAASER